MSDPLTQRLAALATLFMKGWVGCLLLILGNRWLALSDGVLGTVFAGFLLCWVGSLAFSLMLLAAALSRKQRAFVRNAVTQLGVTLTAGILLFLPTLSCSPQAARHATHRSNLRHLSVAMMTYAASHGHLPPHRTDGKPAADGTFPHSWRVYLLPLLEENELFLKIRLNEPWNSEWNRQFHGQMPAVFANPEKRPAGKNAQGLTTYCVIVGKNTLFPENGEEAPQTFPDPVNPTVWLAESAPGCWMDPNHDLPREMAVRGVNLPGGLQNFQSGKTQNYAFGMTDGSVLQFSSDELTPERLRVLFSESAAKKSAENPLKEKSEKEN